MCLASAYVKKANTEEMLLENVITMEFSAPYLVFTNIFRETRKISAQIKQIDFENGYVLLEERPEGKT